MINDVWQVSNIKNGHPEKIPDGHPCQLPEQIVERLILSMTKANDFVLDPFGGVATSLVVAVKHGRIGLGAEVDKRYYTLGEKRLQTILPPKRLFNVETEERLVYPFEGAEGGTA